MSNKTTKKDSLKPETIQIIESLRVEKGDSYNTLKAWKEGNKYMNEGALVEILEIKDSGITIQDRYYHFKRIIPIKDIATELKIV